MIRRRLIVPMRDGTRLITYISLPGDGEGQYPVILRRNPYHQKPDQEEPEEISLPDTSAASQGFVEIEQHCRGTGGSEGDFIPFFNERTDGLDTIAWIETQPWFNGNIYLGGGSYLSFVQLALLDSVPSSVKGSALTVMCHKGNPGFFKNGVYKADVGPIWGAGVYHPWELLKGDPYRAFEDGWFQYPMRDYAKRIYGRDVSWFVDAWKLRDDPGGNPGGFSDALHAIENLKIPVLITDGWAEMFLDGMTEMWEEIPEEVRKKSAFQLGPWSHGCQVEDDWEYPFGENGESPEVVPEFELRWFLHLEKQENPAPLLPGKIRCYVPGDNVWKYYDSIPSGKGRETFWLGENNILENTPPEAGEISYVFDPLNPPSFPGGPNTFCHTPRGYAVQPECNFRPDVESFVSASLESKLTIAGKIRVHLAYSSSAEATAFIVRFSVVEKNGRATVIQDCPMETFPHTPGEKAQVQAFSGPLLWTLRPGERLRVDISSADAHSYRVHSNTAECQFTAENPIQAENHIYLGESFIELPIE